MRRLSYLLGVFLLLLSATADGQERIEVTGKLLEVNGVSRIPAGLFGVHADWFDADDVARYGLGSYRQIYAHPNGVPVKPGDPTPVLEGWKPRHIPRNMPLIIETWWDRYQPALMLVHPDDWQKRLQSLAADYTKRSKKSDRHNVVELWNEPFLHWAKMPGVNYDGDHFDQSDGTAEGTPVRIRGRKQPLRHLVWAGRKDLKCVEQGTGRTSYLATRYMLDEFKRAAKENKPEPYKHGDVFAFRGKKYDVVATPWAKDPTQFSNFSGRQNAEFYIRMLEVLAPALKKGDPKLKVVGGWGWPMHQHDWAIWDVWMRPMIDRTHRWIDGVNEHHYWVGAETMAATAEIVCAYGASEHGKWLKLYNTEAGGHWHAVRRNAGTHNDGPNHRARREMLYTIRDILHHLDLVPDKVATRTAHTPRAMPGTLTGLELLKDLRGQLIETQTSHGHLWCVASLDGQRMIVAAYNDQRGDQSPALQVTAPPGMQFTGARRSWVDVPADEKQNPGDRPHVSLRIHSETVEADGQAFQAKPELRGREAVVWVFGLSGKPPAEPQVTRRQFFARGVLDKLPAGQSADYQIVLPDKHRATAEAAFVRLTLQHADTARTKVLLNGRPVNLDATSGWIRRIPVAPKALRAENTIRIEHQADESGKAKDLRVGAVSLVLQHRK